MNPFKQPLNRSGFLLWSLLCMGLALGFAWSVRGLKGRHGVSAWWLLYELAIGVAVVLLYGFVFVRRLQNAGLSRWFALCIFIPFVATAAWIVLLFIPPEKAKSVDAEPADS